MRNLKARLARLERRAAARGQGTELADDAELAAVQEMDEAELDRLILNLLIILDQPAEPAAAVAWQQALDAGVNTLTADEWGALYTWAMSDEEEAGPGAG